MKIFSVGLQFEKMFKMKSVIVLICLIVFAHFDVISQQELFQKHLYHTDDIEMPYRLHIPEKTDSGKVYPLILYLHGSGERGRDNEITLNNGVLNFVAQEYITIFPSFILVPQCPADYRWVEVHWALPSHIMPENISLPLFHTMNLLDEIIKTHPVDTDRLYVTGLSMGGFGTWDLISRYPDKFAAAVPVCGGGDTAKAKLLTKIPVWAFHGELDKVVIPERSLQMVHAINSYGGNARLTLYQQVEHNSWIQAYSDPQMIYWLFSQTKQRIFHEDEY